MTTIKIHPQKPKALMCWSGGKDSAMALHRASQDFEVVTLMTTLNVEFKRISMHGVREELLDAQADAIGLPLIKVWGSTGSNQEYEKQMTNALNQAKAIGVTHVIFGDIFLQDLREYRERQLAKVGLIAEFPLWQSNTTKLIQEFVTQGFQTITCCINDGYLDESWAGREIDTQFIQDLPPIVDPCGENGEYHTFCFAGPIFHQPIRFTRGEVIYRPLPTPMPISTQNHDRDDSSSDQYECISLVETKGFWFCDLETLPT
ncbi:diphthine--ammonia ligase [Aquirhabdus sp.]|uniref:Dph6-related ATP pyrophosphatase n=1 Tax=Aquirhabdus sp. TaxID=2824160 RepID=UPI00396C2CF6